ncbi:hypothetical protein A0H81_05378 [Grifola frondosa]|uniref:Holliday junction resolvase Gen1 C-terminal domain-containing protein n=1 Tax=Grifola frondosa TaxID=5627 RepID=A0A1C7MBW6_GRIFR|nr:hypothetical protein A0H81_05378 [Grifola frondosa]
MNRIGVIDAVLSDDVDTFLFGALMVVRKRLILIGVLRGGDYNQGLSGCGVAIAHGLAKCGFGDTLLQAARTLSREQLLVFLNTWREELRQELRTNSQGRLPRKSPSLAKSIPNDFPNLDVLLSYTNPATSEAKGAASKNITVDWDKEPDLGKVAALCEMYFEWGIKEIIIKRFRTVLWPCAVLRILRRSVLLADRRAARVAERASGAIPSTPKKSHRNQPVPVGTPSTMIARHFSCLQLGTPQHRDAGSDPFDDENPEEPLIVKIHSSRTHVSTDGVLEYRLEIAPAQLVRLCEAGVKGLRTAVPPELEESEDNVDDDEDDDSGAHKRKTKGKKPPPDPESHLRIWLPACMVRLVEPHLVEDFEETQRQKQAKKAGKATGRGTKSRTVSSPKSKSTKKGKAKVAPIAEEAEELSLSSATEDDIAQKPTKATTAKKTTGKSSTSAAVTTTAVARKARPDNLPQKVNDFFTASKVNRTKMSKPQSSTQRISTLFADFSSSGLQPHKRGKKTGHSVVDLDLSEDGSEDDLPHRPLAPPFPRILLLLRHREHLHLLQLFRLELQVQVVSYHFLIPRIPWHLPRNHLPDLA